MKSLLFTPDDVLFFRDGRPMEGASSGQGARMPAPHVLNSALHAACHRAFADDAEVGHTHRASNRPITGRQRADKPSERFGSLFSCGPFPVQMNGGENWFFPAPADLACKTVHPTVAPVDTSLFPGTGSNEALLPLGSLNPPSKDPPPQWLSKATYEHYLVGQGSASQLSDTACTDFLSNREIFVEEPTIGIGIDPESSTTVSGKFYSKIQMRLHPEFRLGAYATLPHSHNPEVGDLLDKLFPATGRISLGGESRTCSVDCQSVQSLHFPVGPRISGNRVKWILLTPAIFPYLPSGKRAGKADHPGGWLPSWVEPIETDGKITYRVQLLDGPGAAKAKRMGIQAGQPIRAKLVAARIERSIAITGWSMGGSAAPEVHESGARSTLLAVPAGSIYYFEAEDETHAQKLADALNWYGVTANSHNPTTIVNRRSSLLGEKGYGIGVCAPWDHFSK